MSAQPTTTNKVKSYDKLFIGGKWVAPSSNALIEVISPVTEEVIATVPDARNDDVDAAVATARNAFDNGPWPRMTPTERTTVLKRVIEAMIKRSTEFESAFTAEIGAPSAVSAQLQSFAIDIWQQAMEFHKTFTFEERREWAGGQGKLVKEPVGVVATIIPWNGPVTIASMSMAPALVAGCTVILKPATDCPLTSMVLAEAFKEAGLPEGVVSILPADREVGQHLVSHPGIDKVTFTGSTEAGKKIMSACAERIARVTLELGGKSAAIIADDIELNRVFPDLVFNGIGHSGQVCAALTRILVPRERQDEIVAQMKQIMESTKVGDPAEPDTVLGPLVSQRQRDRVEGYIKVGQEEGATLVTGGGRPANLDRGWYVEPTLFADVTKDMRIAQEEIFGPVLAVMPFDSHEEAVEIANSSIYGLSGAVYAADENLAEDIASKLRTGQVSINSWTTNLLQPYGGYKQSGIGRVGNVEGLEEYLESKMIQRV